MHEIGLTHTDLKPENILLKNSELIAIRYSKVKSKIMSKKHLKHDDDNHSFNTKTSDSSSGSDDSDSEYC